MLAGMIFLQFFLNFMKMCSPPSVGSTFSKNDFCKYRVQEDVSIPKLAWKPALMGEHFHLVLCKKYYVLLSERKIAHFGSSVWHHFCSRMHFKANFHIFGLDFAIFLGKLCWPSLLSPLAWQPSIFIWHARICKSQAVSASIICRAAVCPSLRAFNKLAWSKPVSNMSDGQRA